MFKLRFPNNHPEDKTIHLAFNYAGFVGVLYFEGGQWYSLNARSKEVMSTTSSFVWLSDKDKV